MNGASFAADLMKLLRGQALTAEEVAIDLDCSKPTARDWLNEFCAQGVIEVKEGKPGIGRTPKVYSLARQWGGTE